MKATSFAGMTCSIAGAVEAIGDRWGFLILRDLMFGLSRYDALRKSTGIPAQTLANRLRHLEEAGLVRRVRYQERPPRDGYALTPKGQDLWKVLAALREWGDRWQAHGAEGPPVETVDRDSGHALRLMLTDAQTGAAAALERVMFRPGPGADDKTRQRLGAGGADEPTR